MLPNWYTDYKKLIDKSINTYLIEYFKSEKNKGLDIIKEASIYSCKGGKRIRSILALEFYLIFSGEKFENINQNSDIIKFCIGLELLHAYSLVHDDLPAMDNDEYRRGELTTWKKFGETNAILAGDLLQAMGFEILGGINNDSNYSVLSFYLGQSVGLRGMLGGQVLDIYYENNPDNLNLDNLIEVHNKKTGALIETSIFGGLLIAEFQTHYVKDKKTNNNKSFIDFGQKIGLAFQIKDDLLDVEGTLEETGKSVGDGEEKGFVYFLGLKETHKYLDNLISECKNIISELNSEKLEFLVEYIGTRKK